MREKAALAKKQNGVDVFAGSFSRRQPRFQNKASKCGFEMKQGMSSENKTVLQMRGISKTFGTNKVQESKVC